MTSKTSRKRPEAQCAAFFHGLRVELLAPIPSDSADYKRIHRSDAGQLGCRSIFDLLYRKLPADGFCIAAITMELLVQEPDCAVLGLSN